MKRFHKSKINDETLILTYNENEIQKRFKKQILNFHDDRIIVQKEIVFEIARKLLVRCILYRNL